MRRLIVLLCVLVVALAGCETKPTAEPEFNFDGPHLCDPEYPEEEFRECMKTPGAKALPKDVAQLEEFPEAEPKDEPSNEERVAAAAGAIVLAPLWLVFCFPGYVSGGTKC